LREIVGQTPETVASLEKELTLEFPAPAKMQSWSDIAMDNSPTISSARYGTEIARKEIEVQRSGHYPTLDAVGSYRIARSDARFGSDSNTGQVGLQLAVPIYTSGGVDASTRQAQFQFQAAQDTLDQARRSVDRLVRDAYRGIESSISRVKALKTTTVSAQSALDATEAGYEVGTRTLVDVLNSQSTLFSAQRDYANSRYDYILNNLRLRQAAGVLGREDLENVSQLLQP
jgi:outer membrane protein